MTASSVRCRNAWLVRNSTGRGVWFERRFWLVDSEAGDEYPQSQSQSQYCVSPTSLECHHADRPYLAFAFAFPFPSFFPRSSSIFQPQANGRFTTPSSSFRKPSIAQNPDREKHRDHVHSFSGVVQLPHQNHAYLPPLLCLSQTPPKRLFQPCQSSHTATSFFVSRGPLTGQPSVR